MRVQVASSAETVPAEPQEGHTERRVYVVVPLGLVAIRPISAEAFCALHRPSAHRPSVHRLVSHAVSSHASSRRVAAAPSVVGETANARAGEDRANESANPAREMHDARASIIDEVPRSCNEGFCFDVRAPGAENSLVRPHPMHNHRVYD